MSIRVSTIGITSLALALLSTSALGASEPVTGPLACDFSGEDSPMITVTINNLDIEGAVLRFPRDYDNGVFKNATERDGLLLRAYNTDFSAYPQDELLTAEGKSKLLFGIYDKLAILLTSLVPMDDIALNAVYFNYKLERKPSILGVPTTTLENGLSELPYPSHFRRKEVFFHKEGGRYTDVIACSRDQDVPSPHCRHTFESDAYDVKITYSKTHLNRWQELRDGTSRLLECFTIQEPTELPDIKRKRD